ncbi:Disintegrin and metalloproteinase domain-containing protein 8-like, partial [Homarus americanus]
NLFVLVLRLGLLVAASHPSNPHTSISPTDEGVLKVSSVIRSTGEYLQTTDTGDFITLAEGSYPLKLISSTSPPDEGSDKSVRVLGVERDAGELLRTTDELRRGGARDTSRDETPLTLEFLSGDHRLVLKASPKVCEYQGVVKGVANSWAALTLCGGVTTTVQKFTGGEDNSGNSSRNKRRKAVAVSHRERRAAFYGGSLWTKDTTRFVELVLVADKSYYDTYGPNTRERCKAIVNIVNAIYRPLGLVVVLVHIEVWKTRDQFQVTNNFKSNLEKLKEYTEQLDVERPDLNYDNIVLITVVDFDGTTVGFATVGGMCSNKDSVSVVQDRSEELGVVAQTMAHEMGHNLAMVHDEDIEDCLCEANKCIMSQTGDKQLLASGFESNSFKCLKNVPTTLVSDSSCGNGVVDPDAGEQCDCGPVEFCDNLCCVAATCRLAVNASCATGSCCDT